MVLPPYVGAPVFCSMTRCTVLRKSLTLNGFWK